MNSSTCFPPVDEHALLMEIVRNQRILLTPALLYTILTMIVGTVGNPFAIYIYGCKWPETTTRWFLLWMACVDLLNCFITMPTEIYILTSIYYIPNGTFCFITRFIQYLCNVSTWALFVIIAVDRYIRICHPHRSPLSVHGAKIACVVSMVLGAAVSWPTLFLYGRKEIRIPTHHGYISGVMCNIRNEMDHTMHPYVFYISLSCMAGLCFLILSVLYFLIARVIVKRRHDMETRRGVRLQVTPQTEQTTDDVREHAKSRPPVSTVTQEQTSIRSCDTRTSRYRSLHLVASKSTLMLLAITAVFVLSFVPCLTIFIIRQRVGPSFYPSLSPMEKVLVHIFVRSHFIENCANPIVYGLCSSKFTNEAKKVFRKAMCRHESSISQSKANNSQVQIGREVQEPDK